MKEGVGSMILKSVAVNFLEVVVEKLLFCFPLQAFQLISYLLAVDKFETDVGSHLEAVA
jgi:hypothetical protein